MLDELVTATTATSANATEPAATPSASLRQHCRASTSEAKSSCTEDLRNMQQKSRAAAARHLSIHDLRTHKVTKSVDLALKDDCKCVRWGGGVWTNGMFMDCTIRRLPNQTSPFANRLACAAHSHKQRLMCDAHAVSAGLEFTVIDTGSTFHHLPHATNSPRATNLYHNMAVSPLAHDKHWQFGASPAPGGAGRPSAGPHYQHHPSRQPVWAHNI
jgi:hypothetical protein